MQTAITIIGAGRVGSALGKAFLDKGFKIDMVVSRSNSSASELASKLDSRSSTDPSTFIESDFLILSVPDGELINISQRLSLSDRTIVLHTAGAHGLEVFGDLNCVGKGILYPFQTFSMERQPDISKVPFLIEADNEINCKRIERLALSLSGSVYRVPLKDRQLVHIAGVFVNNYVNRLYSVGEELIDRTGLPSNILQPLIDETRDKAKDLGTEKSQTGPALRNDINTIEKHLDLLSFSPEIRDLYTILSESIKNKFRE